MTIHEVTTRFTPAMVVDRAQAFFELASSSYAAFTERTGDNHIKLHMEVGEIVIGAIQEGDFTRVRGSASRGAHLLTRFMSTLEPAMDAHETVNRYLKHETQGVLTLQGPDPQAAISATSGASGASGA